MKINGVEYGIARELTLLYNGHCETMLWHEQLPEDYTVHDIIPATAQKLRREMVLFRKLALTGGITVRSEHWWDMGCYFYFCRSCCGRDFMDRSWLTKAAIRKLQNIIKENFSEVHPRINSEGGIEL